MAPAWAGVVVAATDREDASGRALGCSLLLAALSLPGVPTARADTPPERAQLSYKYLDYLDFQDGWDRIGVQAHALSAVLPIAGKWSVESGVTVDTISGASPAYHSQRLRSAEVKDQREAVDFKVSRYFSRGSLSFSFADSREEDYLSDAWSLSGSVSTESKNTTLNFGLGITADEVNVPTVGVVERSKNIYQGMLGLTQILTPRDIAQLTLTYSSGDGYFSDPYKLRDKRPDYKRQTTVLARWNHQFAATKGAARLSYRYYTDTFDVRAHTATLEYVQPLPQGWTVAPFVRAHAQSAASFYLEADNNPFPSVAPRDQLQSQDQRLSAFGGGSLGVKLSKYVTADVLVDFRYERYEQHADWYPFGSQSRGIDPFMADIYQVGVSWYF